MLQGILKCPNPHKNPEITMNRKSIKQLFAPQFFLKVRIIESIFMVRGYKEV